MATYSYSQTTVIKKFSYTYGPNVTYPNQDVVVGLVPDGFKWTVKRIHLVYNDIYNGAMSFSFFAEQPSPNAGFSVAGSSFSYNGSLGGVGLNPKHTKQETFTDSQLLGGDRMRMQLNFNAGDVGIGAEYFEVHIYVEESGPATA